MRRKRRFEVSHIVTKGESGGDVNMDNSIELLVDSNDILSFPDSCMRDVCQADTENEFCKRDIRFYPFFVRQMYHIGEISQSRAAKMQPYAQEPLEICGAVL